jgi:mycothiol synthase
VAPRIRQAAVEDSDRLAEALNAISETHYGEAETTAEEVRSWFSRETFDGLVAERDGDLVGVALRRRIAERDRAWFTVHTLGDAEVGRALLLELENRASADVGTGALAFTFVREVDESMQLAIRSAGYELVRHAFRMSIQLDETVQSPAWPSGIEVSTHRPEHERAIYAALDEAFSDHWEYRAIPFEDWRRWDIEVPGFDPTFWHVAWDGSEVAGASLCRVHPSGDLEHGLVQVLGVRRAWRRRGLGRALLLHSFRHMLSRGMRRASLFVDGENTTGAVRLYERAGMTVVRRADCFRKAL